MLCAARWALQEFGASSSVSNGEIVGIGQTPATCTHSFLHLFMLKNGRCYSRIGTISTAINVLDPQATTPIWINDADASPIMILLRGESGRRWSNCSNWISSQRTRILLFQYYGALCFHPKSKQGQWYEVTSHVKPSGKSLQDLAVVR